MAETQPEARHVEHGPETTLLTNILTVVGFIIVIVIVVWGLVHLATLSRGWFTNLFPRSVASIQVSAPTDAMSGTPFNISWKSSSSDKGTYALLYPCQPGLKFDVMSSNGSTSGVPCGAAFSVSNAASSSLTVTPHLTGNTSTKAVLSMIFIPATKTSGDIQGSASVTIHPASNTVSTTPTTPTKPVVTTKPSTTYTSKPTTYAGPADLAVTIISTNVDQTGMATVVFSIANRGGASTGVWYFDAQLPTISGYMYMSPAQSPLNPGDHVVSTLHFTQVNPNGGTFIVTADPSNSVRESSKVNNSASQWVGMPAGYQVYSNYQPQYTQPYVY